MLNSNGKWLLGSLSDSYLTLKTILGTTMNSWSKSNFETTVNWHLYLGTGSTEPTNTDYCLENPASGLTLINQSMNIASSNTATFIKTLSATWQNNSNDSIDITESAWYANGNGEWNDNFTAMLAREVFDPVTLGPGESYTFTMTIV